MDVLFPEYFQSISIIFPYHGQHVHTMELDKTMGIECANLFLQYFQNISITWKRFNFPLSSHKTKSHVQVSNILHGILFSSKLVLQQGFHYETCLGLNDIRTPQRIWREWKETLITDDTCGQQRRKIKEGEGEGVGGGGGGDTSH